MMTTEPKPTSSDRFLDPGEWLDAALAAARRDLETARSTEPAEESDPGSDPSAN